MKDLYEIQEKFTTYFIKERLGKELGDLSDEERLLLVKDYVLHLHSELSSILTCTSYKMHRSPMDNLINTNIFEEIIDSIKFLLGLWSILGGDFQSLSDIFRQKSEVVSWRWKQDHDIELLADEPVAILDIDGVLAEYPGPMISFMNNECGSNFTSKDEIKNNLGIIRYEELKTKYRTSGFKATLPMVAGAKTFLNCLEEKNIPIVLISSRPYEKYLNILPDTLRWAKENGIKFAALYFDREKSLKVAKRFRNAMLFLDDNESFVKDICNSGLVGEGSEMKVFLFDRSGRKKAPEGARVVTDFEQVIRIIENTKNPGQVSSRILQH